MISVILIEPETPGNIGAICRVMANFDLDDLVIINPKCNIHDSECEKRAMHGLSILNSAKIAKQDIISTYDVVVGTTAKIGNDYNLPRTPMFPDDFAAKVNPKQKTAILIGRESQGLSNKEIELCDYIISIPASTKYPTLNISHACTIIFYELFKTKRKKQIAKKYAPITKLDKELLLQKLDSIFDEMTFATPDKKVTQKRFWKRFIAKADLNKRETQILFGFLGKVEEMKQPPKKK